MELHRDAVKEGSKILLVDDVLATGGTAEAAIKLIQSLKAEVIALLVLMELSFLEGRKRIKIPVESLIIH